MDGRRRRHDQQSKPLPGHHNGDSASDQHDVCRGVHDECSDDDADRLPSRHAERRDLELLDGYERELSYLHHTAHRGASGQANNPLAVTLTNDASMTAASPAACANTYFSMPSITGITATGGAGTATISPATDSWTS